MEGLSSNTVQMMELDGKCSDLGWGGFSVRVSARVNGEGEDSSRAMLFDFVRVALGMVIPHTTLASVRHGDHGAFAGVSGSNLRRSLISHPGVSDGARATAGWAEASA